MTPVASGRVLLVALAFGLGAPEVGAQARAPDGAQAQVSEPRSWALPLTASPGDPQRGREIVASRQTGLCLLCHSGPFEPTTQQGNLAGSLAGAGLRWSAADLRERIANPRRINPDSLMPAFFHLGEQRQVSRAFEGRTLLSAQQLEDVVAFLLTLREIP